MNQKDHWERVYSSKTIDRLGWYTPHLETSLSWIQALDLAPADPIIDVGGGASTLVDDLLHKGYRSITVLDISENALSFVKHRLGGRAESVTWLTGDVTSMVLPSGFYQLWHDRAVFHFLTSPELRREYQQTLSSSLKPGGSAIIGTFAFEAPPRCSGLAVQRYSPEQLLLALGSEFQLMRHRKVLHITPGGVKQMYLYCHLVKTA